MQGPQAPDPYKTAEAQSQFNIQTGAANQAMNMVNQATPWGSLNYQQSGTSQIIGPNGEAITVPQYTSTTTLSPAQQAIFEQTQGAQSNLAELANQQSQFLQGYLGQSVNTSGVPGLVGSAGQSGNLGPGFATGVDLATSYAGADDFSADRQRYEDALWQRTAGDRAAQEEALRTRLVNSGLREGSAAWNAEMERLGRQNTDARLATLLAGGDEQARMVGLARDAAGFGNQAALAQAGFGNQAALARRQFGNQAALTNAQFQNAARGQGLQEAYAARAQPINELAALMGGSQVQQPNFMNTPQTGVAGVDYTGLVNQQYQSELANYQAGMGGLFGLGGALISALPFSDRRLKENIRRVGETDAGTPIYTYNYIWGGPTMMGVMAQDVPEASEVDASGYYVVDYLKVR